MRAYASGLDFHLSDEHFAQFFEKAAALGFRGCKIKVGHPDLDWDIQRLSLCASRRRPGRADHGRCQRGLVSPRGGAAARRLPARRVRYLWIEDPCLRDDFDGLREVRAGAPWAHVNSGEYLDLRGKRKLIEARGVDILNVHGNVTDVMRAGWLAAEYGIPVSLGNTMLELGVHMAAALPECRLARIFLPELQPPRRGADRHARRLCLRA